MVQAKRIWLRSLSHLLFVFFLLGGLFVAAGLSVMPVPFLPTVPLVHFYAALSFAALLYLPAKFWIYLLLPGLWLDAMVLLPLGSHLLFIMLQYGFIVLMQKTLKDYGFLSQWIVFSVSYVLIFGILAPFSLTQSVVQSLVTILAYPPVLKGFWAFLFYFKRVNDA